MTKLALARCVLAGFGATALSATMALAQAPAAPPKIDAGDTAWIISATGLVLMMSIPGLALFYCGMVRKKNVLATMAQTFAAVALGSIIWMVVCTVLNSLLRSACRLATAVVRSADTYRRASTFRPHSSTDTAPSSGS